MTMWIQLVFTKCFRITWSIYYFFFMHNWRWNIQIDLFIMLAFKGRPDVFSWPMKMSQVRICIRNRSLFTDNIIWSCFNSNFIMMNSIDLKIICIITKFLWILTSSKRRECLLNRCTWSMLSVFRIVRLLIPFTCYFSYLFFVWYIFSWSIRYPRIMLFLITFPILVPLVFFLICSLFFLLNNSW